jgi:YHS domain-containing protein
LVGLGAWLPSVLGGEAGGRPNAQAADDYPLGTCVVSGDKLGEEGPPVVYEYEGRTVKFCCKKCIKDFNADPAKYLKKLDEAVIAKQKPAYPLDTCVVSGKKIGGMGEGVDYVYNNRLVRFCCKGCIPKFKEDPTACLAKIDEAAKAKAAAKP